MKKKPNKIIFRILVLAFWIFALVASAKSAMAWLREPHFSGTLFFIFWVVILFGTFLAICFPKLSKWFETDRPDVKRYEKSGRKKSKAKKII